MSGEISGRKGFFRFKVKYVLHCDTGDMVAGKAVCGGASCFFPGSSVDYGRHKEEC